MRLSRRCSMCRRCRSWRLRLRFRQCRASRDQCRKIAEPRSRTELEARRKRRTDGQRQGRSRRARRPRPRLEARPEAGWPRGISGIPKAADQWFVARALILGTQPSLAVRPAGFLPAGCRARAGWKPVFRRPRSRRPISSSPFPTTHEICISPSAAVIETGFSATQAKGLKQASPGLPGKKRQRSTGRDRFLNLVRVVPPRWGSIRIFSSPGLRSFPRKRALQPSRGALACWAGLSQAFGLSLHRTCFESRPKGAAVAVRESAVLFFDRNRTRRQV